MKIAISATGREIDSLLDLRFGRCDFFQIYDTEKDKVNALENEGQTSSGGAGIAAAQQLINEKVDIVITGNLGPNAFELIKNAGIKAYRCGSVPIKSALDKFNAGELSELGEAGSSHQGMGPGFGGGR